MGKDQQRGDARRRKSDTRKAFARGKADAEAGRPALPPVGLEKAYYDGYARAKRK